MSSSAVIAGGTGLIGQACLRQLLERYDSVTALVRRPLELRHPRLTERLVDFDRLDTLEIPTGANIYCALGTTIKKAGSEEVFRKVDQHYPRVLAQRAGGGRFVLVSSVGADARSNNFYLRVKGELEDSLRALPLEALHVFRPSILIGERPESRRAEAMGIAVARSLGFLLAGPLRKYRAIPAEVVARAMVVAGSREASGRFIYHYDEIRHLVDVR